MNYLIIENAGEIEVDGLRLMGASTKRGSNKIGFFGTGNKYALAVLLRLGAKVVVYSGARKLEIGTREVFLRGQKFQEMVVDNVNTGTTTDVGPKWLPWMALREFWCNAIDEGGQARFVGEVPTPSPGKTYVCISMVPEVRDVEENWEKYFRAPGKLGLLPKIDSKLRIYRRGILVHETDERSKFDYECPDVTINEERMAAQDLRFWCWAAINAASVGVRKELVADMHPFEAHLPQEYWGASTDWVDVLEFAATKEQVAFHKEDLVGATVVPDAWLGILRHVPGMQTAEEFLGGRTHVKVELDWENPRAAGVGGQVVKDALKICAKAGFEIDQGQVILVEEFCDGYTKGKWDGKYIYVLLGQTLFETVRTLLHELAHKKSGYEDNSRGFESKLDFMLAEAVMKAARVK